MQRFGVTMLCALGLAALLPAGAPVPPPEVFVIPDAALGDEAAAVLARMVGEYAKVRAKPMLTMGLDPALAGPDGQLDGDAVLASLQPVADRARRFYDAPNALVILVTTRDINSARMGTRFLFSYHNRQTRLSVVSMARTQVPGADGKLDAQQVLTRVFKLVLRSVGEQVLLLPRSSDPASVMYSPLNGVDDLDMIGTKLGSEI